MRKNKLITSTLLLITLIACNKQTKSDQVALEISNHTNQTIERVYLTAINGQAKTKDSKMAPSEVIVTNIDFSNVAKSDGSYSLFFKYEDASDTVRKDFGYYTNGLALDNKFIIAIYNDTVIIKSEPRELGKY